MREALKDWQLVCCDCGLELPAEPRHTGCPACHQQGRVGLLELVRIRQPQGSRPISGSGMQRYLGLLPTAAPHEWRSLGEGGTALVSAMSLNRALNLPGLHLKRESGNPTYSFKDRYVSLTMNAAHASGARETAVSSTGNLAVSVAAYAAAYGLACTAIAPRDIPQGIAGEVRALGCELDLVPAEDRFKVFDAFAERPACYPVGLFLRRKIQNPFGVEAYRTLAYEIVESLGRSPDYVLFPCARGNGLYGAWKGFQDAAEWGWTSGTPQMVGCQPRIANSLELSMQRGGSRAIETEPATSIARSISETLAGDHAILALRQSGGLALSATEEDITDAQQLMCRHGFHVEAASAVTVACVPKLVGERGLRGDETVVCILTGPGFRW